MRSQHIRMPPSRQRQYPRRQAEQQELRRSHGLWPRCGQQGARAPEFFFGGMGGWRNAPAKGRGAAMNGGTVHPSSHPRWQTATVLTRCAGAAASTGAGQDGSGCQAVPSIRRPGGSTAGLERRNRNLASTTRRGPTRGKNREKKSKWTRDDEHALGEAEHPLLLSGASVARYSHIPSAVRPPVTTHSLPRGCGDAWP